MKRQKQGKPGRLRSPKPGTQSIRSSSKSNQEWMFKALCSLIMAISLIVLFCTEFGNRVVKTAWHGPSSISDPTVPFRKTDTKPAILGINPTYDEYVAVSTANGWHPADPIEKLEVTIMKYAQVIDLVDREGVNSLSRYVGMLDYELRMLLGIIVRSSDRTIDLTKALHFSLDMAQQVTYRITKHALAVPNTKHRVVPMTALSHDVSHWMFNSVKALLSVLNQQHQHIILDINRHDIQTPLTPFLKSVQYKLYGLLSTFITLGAEYLDDALLLAIINGDDYAVTLLLKLDLLSTLQLPESTLASTLYPLHFNFSSTLPTWSKKGFSGDDASGINTRKVRTADHNTGIEKLPVSKQQRFVNVAHELRYSHIERRLRKFFGISPPLSTVNHCAAVDDQRDKGAGDRQGMDDLSRDHTVYKYQCSRDGRNDEDAEFSPEDLQDSSSTDATINDPTRPLGLKLFNEFAPSCPRNKEGNADVTEENGEQPDLKEEATRVVSPAQAVLDGLIEGCNYSNEPLAAGTGRLRSKSERTEAEVTENKETAVVEGNGGYDPTIFLLFDDIHTRTSSRSGLSDDENNNAEQLKRRQQSAQDMGMEALWALHDPICRIDRVDIAELTREDFQTEYVMLNRPVILTDTHRLITAKNSHEAWYLDSIVNKLGRMKEIAAVIPYGTLFGKKEQHMTIKSFVRGQGGMQTVTDSLKKIAQSSAAAGSAQKVFNANADNPDVDENVDHNAGARAAVLPVPLSAFDTSDTKAQKRASNRPTADTLELQTERGDSYRNDDHGFDNEGKAGKLQLPMYIFSGADQNLNKAMAKHILSELRSFGQVEAEAEAEAEHPSHHTLLDLMHSVSEPLPSDTISSRCPPEGEGEDEGDGTSAGTGTVLASASPSSSISSHTYQQQQEQHSRNQSQSQSNQSLHPSWKSQVFLGPAMSGAPFHHHAPAFNLVMFGAKVWSLSPPGRDLYSSLHPLEWMQTGGERSEFYPYSDGLDTSESAANGDEKANEVTSARPFGAAAMAADPQSSSGGEQQQQQLCKLVQQAGEVLYVPRHWSHQVLNVAESVGFAVEISNYIY